MRIVALALATVIFFFNFSFTSHNVLNLNTKEKNRFLFQVAFNTQKQELKFSLFPFDKTNFCLPFEGEIVIWKHFFSQKSNLRLGFVSLRTLKQYASSNRIAVFVPPENRIVSHPLSPPSGPLFVFLHNLKRNIIYAWPVRYYRNCFVDNRNSAYIYLGYFVLYIKEGQLLLPLECTPSYEGGTAVLLNQYYATF
ncbi:hypothetical protein D6821_00355 [Candidatus Parcubacteria bacterium]|nr:MAG: hypothetical protein D6821_00355 [Candidatus Parcubacteria bacterium]